MNVKDLKRLIVPLVLMALLITIIATSVYGCLKSRAFRKPLAPNKLEVIAFYENGAGGMFVSSSESLRQNIAHIDTVVPFWASVDPSGNVTTVRSDPSIVDFVHKNDRPLVLLLNNLKRAGVSNASMIETPEARARTISNIVDTIVRQGYDGVHISFDLMPVSARQAFTTFIQDLALEMHSRNKILGVSVFPRLELPASIWGAFDYKAIGQSADYVVLQAYERHWINSPPGPIAPEPWAEASVQRALSEIPARKTVLGIGMYGYDWSEKPGKGTTEYLPAKDALARAKSLGVSVRLDRRSQQPTYRYTVNKVTRVVWFQDANNMRRKMNLARKYGLRGIAIWRLGFEDPGTWEVIRSMSVR